jgi:4-aminobutyrate aminotransferase-like enzyme
VIEDERLVEHAAHVGARLMRSLAELEGGKVRGRGLLIGVGLESGASADRIVNRLRDEGILIGRTGRDGNVLKIRPPLVFTTEDADRLVELLAATVGRRAGNPAAR